jgi:lipopolysaccharide transport system permease protein
LPDWLSLVPAAIVAVLAGICGMLFFRTRAGEMVDEL